MSQRKRYTKQFKEEAIQLVNQEGVSLTQVARDLGINAERYCQFNSGLADWRDENQNTQLPSSSLSLRNHQSRRLALPSVLPQLS